jgi:hypothetical protein
MNQNFNQSGFVLAAVAILALGGVGIYAVVGRSNAVKPGAAEVKSASTGGVDLGLVKLPASAGNIGVGLTKTAAPSN